MIGLKRLVSKSKHTKLEDMICKNTYIQNMLKEEGTVYRRETCVYCGKTIVKRSKEHIIQNALGGLYESKDICCDKCNNYISKYIDAPFTKIFNPIVSRIQNFAKTNNTNSYPLCTGKAKYDNKIYDVQIKNGKVVGCPELSKKMKCDASKLNFEIISYDFHIENNSFKNGITKIAFNFAIEKGIDFEILKKGIEINRKNDGEVTKIFFEYPIIPFVALNPIDDYLELETSMEFYHNLILFSQENMLWCYVDLFNTFQYYVLLSDEWNGNIHVLETYLQLLQKIDRTVPELYIRKPKDILTYAVYFNVEPCMELDVFKKRVKVAIQKESLKKNMSDVVSAKLGMDYFPIDRLKEMEQKEAKSYLINEIEVCLESLLLYFDENDKLKNNTFRQVTQVGHSEVESYPLCIYMLAKEGKINICSYTMKKFKRMNSFLAEIDKIEADDDINYL